MKDDIHIIRELSLMLNSCDSLPLDKMRLKMAGCEMFFTEQSQLIKSRSQCLGRELKEK